MAYDIEITELIMRARKGNRRAWTALIERFLPLVRAIARGYRLTDSDIDDVCQEVWLHLLEHLDRIREPRALPAWLITTARHESLRVIRTQRRTIAVDPLDPPAAAAPVTEQDLDAELLRTEQARVLHDGLAALPPAQRNLLVLLTGEQALSYREISNLLTMPVGSIGPTRARSLDRLRAVPALRDYLFPGGDECPHARPA